MNDKILELWHHGIARQRWGVKNGPPYPLDSKTHGRVVSGKQDALIKEQDESSIGTITGYGGYTTRDRYGSTYVTGLGASKHFKVMQYADGKSTGHTLDELINSSGFMASVRTLQNHGKISGETDLISTNPLLRSVEHEAIFGDPERGFPKEVYEGASNNCLKCSSVLALRAKGYDVTAGLASGGMLSNSTEKYWDGARTYKENSIQNVERRMMSFGNKGMGELKIRRADGNGHSMFFQNERQENGKWKPVVYDGQTGKKIGDIATAVESQGHDFSNFCDIVRLDDASPNFGNMAMDDVFVPRKGKYGLEKPSYNYALQKKTYWDF